VAAAVSPPALSVDPRCSSVRTLTGGLRCRSVPHPRPISHGRAARLPFEDESFDVIVAST
jgi:hypothetical protein